MRVSEKFRGFCRAPVNSEWWQPADSQLPLVYQQLHVSPVHRIPFSKLTPRWIETKRPHILFMCQKCGERRVGRSEWGISLYPLVDIIPSLRINSPRQREMRKERAQAEGGGEGGLKWWSYWFVKEIQRCVFCLNVHINLSCQGWAGIYWHLATQTWIVNFLLGLAAHSLTHQHLVETGEWAPARPIGQFI